MGSVNAPRPAAPAREPASVGKSAPVGSSSSGLPLALVIARYFAYVLIAALAAAGVVFVAFSVLLSTDVVYAANYAAQHVDDAAGTLEEGADPAQLPSCYRWAVLAEDGSVLRADMPDALLDDARQAAFDDERADSYAGGSSGIFVPVRLPDGSVCVLQYDYLPDFASKELRDALPNPQNLLLGVLVVSFAAAVALIAMRAARVLTRKMSPLAEATGNIERGTLDFEVGETNVREINDVLASMERMRAALDASLQAQWAADEAQRRQVAALAHDLKTPLAIARWNADLLAETELDQDQAAAAESLSESVDRMDAYVRLLSETSRLGAGPSSFTVVSVVDLVKSVERQARDLCAANALHLDFALEDDRVPADTRDGVAPATALPAAPAAERDGVVAMEGDVAAATAGDDAVCAATGGDAVVAVGSLRGNAADLERAIMNLVANAADHAPEGSAVHVRFACDAAAGELVVTVRDEGPGFTPDALAHGTERFYSGESHRNAAGNHYGLGLSIAADIVCAHNGTLTLRNADSSSDSEVAADDAADDAAASVSASASFPASAVRGAAPVIRIPL